MPPWLERLLRPLQSEGSAFRLLLWVLVGAMVLVVLVLVVRAVT